MLRFSCILGLLVLLGGGALQADDPSMLWSAGLRSSEAAVRLATLVQLNSNAERQVWSEEQGAAVAGDLLPLLKDPEPRIRAGAARALARCRVAGPVAAPAWANAMHDADVEVRRSVVEAVGLHLSAGVPAAMHSAIPAVRCQRLSAAVRDARAVTPVLRAALGDVRPDVRGRGLEAMHAGLSAFLRVPALPTSEDAGSADTLGQLRLWLPAWMLEWTLLVPEVAPLVGTGPVDQRVRAAEVVENLTRLVRHVTELSTTLSLADREARVLASAQTRLRQVLPSLAAHLEAAPTEVRLALLAVFEAQKENVPGCRPGVVAQLTHAQPAVRWAAVRILGQWGPAADTSDWQRLNALLDDPDLDVRQAAARTVRQWAQAQLQATGPVIAAGGMAAEESLAHLRESLTAAVRAAAHDGPSEQLAALRAVQAAGPEGIIVLPELRDWLSKSEPAVRRFVPQVLLAIGPGAKELVPDLEKALSDDDAEVRAAAAHALLMLRGR